MRDGAFYGNVAWLSGIGHHASALCLNHVATVPSAAQQSLLTWRENAIGRSCIFATTQKSMRAWRSRRVHDSHQLAGIRTGDRQLFPPPRLFADLQRVRVYHGGAYFQLATSCRSTGLCQYLLLATYHLKATWVSSQWWTQSGLWVSAVLITIMLVYFFHTGCSLPFYACTPQKVL